MTATQEHDDALSEFVDRQEGRRAANHQTRDRERAARVTSDSDRRRLVAADVTAEPPRRRLAGDWATDIVPTLPDWLWERWLLRGALNMLTARQGTGKTTLACHIVAMLTRGLPLPGDNRPRKSMRAGFLALEESSDQIVGRLGAAHATTSRVRVLSEVVDVDDEGREIRRPWRLPQDVGALGAEIEEHGLSLVVVDGIGYSITGDSHNYAVVGSALTALATEAARTGAAILGLVHPPKGAADPVTAAIGSTAWSSVPRTSWVMGLDPHDETEQIRVLAMGKSNYRFPDSSLAFSIETDPRFECGAVVGMRETAVSRDEVMAAPMTHEERSERAGAREFVRDLVANGRVKAEEAKQSGRDHGYSDRTLDRARKDEGIAVQREGFGRGSVVWWIAPDHTRQGPMPDDPSGAGGEYDKSGSYQGQHTPATPEDGHSRQPAVTGEHGTCILCERPDRPYRQLGGETVCEDCWAELQPPPDEATGRRPARSLLR